MRSLLLVPFALVCLVGCGGPTIVGKWTSTASTGVSTMEFTSNTFKQVSDSQAMGTKMHVEASGTYTSDGKKISMKITDLKLPEELKALAPMIEKLKEKPTEAEIKLEGDKLTMTPIQDKSAAAGMPAMPSTPQVYTRSK